MCRLGIEFPVYVVSDSFGGRIEGGGGESHDAGCDNGERSSPSPQPTSRTLMCYSNSLCVCFFWGGVSY
jgi:hypothetical protein